jgi:hypothetical protein
MCTTTGAVAVSSYSSAKARFLRGGQDAGGSDRSNGSTNG